MKCKNILVVALAVVITGCCSVCGDKCANSKPSYKLGVARYTMSKYSFERALEILQHIDCHYMGLLDSSIAYAATDEEIARHKE